MSEKTTRGRVREVSNECRNGVRKVSISRPFDDRFSEQLHLDGLSVDGNADAELVEAINLIAKNCGPDARCVLFDPERPQSRKAIMQLSRTADTRQRYRIAGVRDGQFRSVAPQCRDPVFDTIAFAEVPSRLRRARGSLLSCCKMLATCNDRIILEDTGTVAGVCGQAARKLGVFVKRAESQPAVVPRSLKRNVVERMIARCSATGLEIGRAKSALKLTIKSVWDFPEMQRRGLLPSPDEREVTLVEIEQIITAANQVRSCEWG